MDKSQEDPEVEEEEEEGGVTSGPPPPPMDHNKDDNSVACIFCSKRFDSYPSVEEHFHNTHNITPPKDNNKDKSDDSAADDGTEEAPNIKCFLCPVEFSTFEAAGSHYIFSHKLFHLVKKKRNNNKENDPQGGLARIEETTPKVVVLSPRLNPPPLPSTASFQCGLCDFVTDSKDGVRCHAAQKHFNKEQSRTTTTKTTKTTKTKAKTPLKRFRCQFCPFNSTVIWDVRTHMKLEHGRKKEEIVMRKDVEKPKVVDLTEEVNKDNSVMKRKNTVESMVVDLTKELEVKRSKLVSREETKPAPPPTPRLAPPPPPRTTNASSPSSSSTAVVNYKCQYCVFMSRDVEDVKVHIQLLHVKTGTTSTTKTATATATSASRPIPSSASSLSLPSSSSSSMLPLNLLLQDPMGFVDNLISKTLTIPSMAEKDKERKTAGKEVVLYNCKLCNSLCCFTRKADIKSHMAKTHKESSPKFEGGGGGGDEEDDDEGDRDKNYHPVQVLLDCVQCKFTTAELHELDAHVSETHEDKEDEDDDDDDDEGENDGDNQVTKKLFNLRLLCARCPSSKFYSSQGLKTHLRASHGILINEVNVSGALDKTRMVHGAAASASAAEENTVMVTLRKNSCRICRKSFPTLDELKEHAEEAHKGASILKELEGRWVNAHGVLPGRTVRMYSCPGCSGNGGNGSKSVVFPNEQMLSRHCNTSHKGEKLFFCKTCKEGFTSPACLRNHRDVHENPAGFKCPDCATVAKTRTALVKHSVKHSLEVVRCEICDMRFKWRVALSRHVKVVHNTVERNVMCEQCPKTFKTERYRLEHVKKVHTQLRPHLCTACGFRMKSSSQLKLHMKVHESGRYLKRKPKCTREEALEKLVKKKPMICPLCPARFKKQTWLKKHTRLKHPEVVAAM